MKINKIKKLKNGKYKLELDNSDSIVTFDEVILNHNLLFNKEVDYDLYIKLSSETEYYTTYNKIIKFITIKMRSRLEIIKYMEKIGVINKEKMLNDLLKINLINDNIFLKAFINDKITLTNDGPYKIKKELLEHDIDEKLIDEELAKYDDNLFIQKINKIIQKKIRTNTKSSKYILKQKIFSELLNLGYQKELINNILNNINLNDDKQIEKEYNLLLKKLSLKYKDDALYFQIKKKLYSKGFSQESINELKKTGS